MTTSSRHTFDRAYWEQHWDESILRGSHQTPPHPHLATFLSDLAPGTALEAGCGTGAEAIWLAEHGWRVTGADISAGALAVAAERARAAEVTERTTWIEADLGTWAPETGFDLVSTHFAHPAMPQLDFYRRIAEWVAPGGTLFIASHATGHHGNHPDANAHPVEATATIEGIIALLPADEWSIVAAEEVELASVHADAPTHRRDVVVRASRIG